MYQNIAGKDPQLRGGPPLPQATLHFGDHKTLQVPVNFQPAKFWLRRSHREKNPTIFLSAS